MPSPEIRTSINRWRRIGFGGCWTELLRRRWVCGCRRRDGLLQRAGEATSARGSDFRGRTAAPPCDGLKSHTRLERLAPTDVTVTPIAVSINRKASFLDQVSGSQLSSATLKRHGTVELEVEARSLEDILAEIGRVDLMKMDIHGAELEVLGARAARCRRGQSPMPLSERTAGKSTNRSARYWNRPSFPSTSTIPFRPCSPLVRLSPVLPVQAHARRTSQ